jgi:hydroxypyruvate isomerase
MSKFAANLTMLFIEVPFLERFAAARDAGFEAVEFSSPTSGRPPSWAAACASRALPGPVQHAAGQLGRG